MIQLYRSVKYYHVHYFLLLIYFSHKHVQVEVIFALQLVAMFITVGLQYSTLFTAHMYLGYKSSVKKSKY